jgi:hypothetical protein
LSAKDIEAVCVGDRAGIHYRVAVCERDDGPHVLLERRCGEYVMFEDRFDPEYANELAFTLLEAAMSAGSSALD